MLCSEAIVAEASLTLESDSGTWPEGDPAAECGYRRRIRAWSLYDWANSGFITVTSTTFFPPFFVAIAAPALVAASAAPGTAALARHTASNVYALTVSAALLTAAIVSPLLGSWTDITGRRKGALLVTTAVGSILASAMVTLATGRWVMALALCFGTQVAVNLALGLYSSLLPHVARPGDLDRASSLGYALGYVGGGLLLAVCSGLYFAAPSLGLTHDMAVRLAFASVGIWWLAFTLPLARLVPEPPGLSRVRDGSRSAMRDALRRLAQTIQDARRYRQLFTMLIAFWLYMEGIGAIILLATAYGAALGLNTGVLIGTLLMTQLVAYPYSLLFARMADPTSPWRGAIVAMLLWTGITLPILGIICTSQGLDKWAALGLVLLNQGAGAGLAATLGRSLCGRLARGLDAKHAVILGLAIYTVIPIWGYFLTTQAEFLLIGWLVGTVQGGTQALSRSIFAALSPRARSGELFGLYGLADKFAGILGPLLYGLVGQLTHNPRASVLSIAAFFLAGIAVLARVDVDEGRALAMAEDAAASAPPAAG